MKKAINLYVSPIDNKEKLKMIVEAGFDGIYTGINNSDKSMKLDDIISFAKNNNFSVPQMHCSYYEPDLVYLWKDGKLGDNLIDDLLNQIDITAKFNIKNFIIHTCGDFNPPRSLIGIERIEKLLVKCNQYDINLCIENLYDFEQMKYIFDKIKNKNLKVCYDCGHNNCLNPQDDIFDYFKDKISVLHLHDNHGKPEFGNGDEHLMLGEGILNLDDIAKKISQLDEDIVLCAEYREKYNVDLDYFKRAKKSLDNLEELILKYKNKKK